MPGTNIPSARIFGVRNHCGDRISSLSLRKRREGGGLVSRPENDHQKAALKVISTAIRPGSVKSSSNCQAAVASASERKESPSCCEFKYTHSCMRTWTLITALLFGMNVAFADVREDSERALSALSGHNECSHAASASANPSVKTAKPAPAPTDSPRDCHCDHGSNCLFELCVARSPSLEERYEALSASALIPARSADVARPTRPPSV